MEEEVKVVNGSNVPQTMIRIDTSTRDRLKKFGAMGDSYDTALNKVLDELEKLRKKDNSR